MGKRGPAPKPTKLKLLEGTFRPDRAPEHEPEPTAGIPTCPAWILADRDARAEWDRVIPELAELGLLSAKFGAVLEGYCANYATAVKAERRKKTKGLVIKTPFGDKPNPAIAIATRAWAEVRKFGAEYGLSPASRTRINAPVKAPKKDPTEELLFGHRRSRA